MKLALSHLTSFRDPVQAWEPKILPAKPLPGPSSFFKNNTLYIQVVGSDQVPLSIHCILGIPPRALCLICLSAAGAGEPPTSPGSKEIQILFSSESCNQLQFFFPSTVWGWEVNVAQGGLNTLEFIISLPSTPCWA